MAADSVARGTVIGGRFQVETSIGVGGLGELYRALDLKTQKPIAIRLLAPHIAGDEATLDRLRAQVKAASQLQHKNIASTYGMGKEGALRYIAEEFIDGQSLRVLLDKKRKSGRTFSLKGAYNVLAHVCNALSHAHPTMPHGLPGPGATLVNKVGRVKLCEFGVVCALPATGVQRMGDHRCLAPELAADPLAATAAADIYSLGVVLYELLTGQVVQQPGALMPASQLIAGLPPDVDEVLARCLEHDPRARYGDAQQLKAAFYASVQSASDQADVEGVVDPASLEAAAPARRPSASKPGTRSTQGTGTAAVPPNPSANHPQPAQPRGAKPLQPIPTPAPAARQLSVEEHIARARGDSAEKWLVHKDRLDFGPFALAELMLNMSKGQFGPDDIVLDQESGERTRIRTHPQLRDFCVVLEKHLEADRMVRAEQSQQQRDKRRRTILVVTITSCLMVLGAGGAVTVYYLRKDPETREKIVYREKQSDLDKLLKNIDVNWRKEPEDQAARRRKYGVKRRGKTGPASNDDVTYLGDATKEGGDALLTPAAVQRVMQSNFNRLIPCVYEELRRTPSMRQVNIDFGVRGTGVVSSVNVNGQAGGPLVSCILTKMQRIQFPKFDGTLTRASFSMSLK
jgi:serine/threonine-protein kinase